MKKMKFSINGKDMTKQDLLYKIKASKTDKCPKCGLKHDSAESCKPAEDMEIH